MKYIFLLLHMLLLNMYAIESKTSENCKNQEIEKIYTIENNNTKKILYKNCKEKKYIIYDINHAVKEIAFFDFNGMIRLKNNSLHLINMIDTIFNQKKYIQNNNDNKFMTQQEIKDIEYVLYPFILLDKIVKANQKKNNVGKYIFYIQVGKYLEYLKSRKNNELIDMISKQLFKVLQYELKNSQSLYEYRMILQIYQSVLKNTKKTDKKLYENLIHFSPIPQYDLVYILDKSFKEDIKNANIHNSETIEKYNNYLQEIKKVIVLKNLQLTHKYILQLESKIKTINTNTSKSEKTALYLLQISGILNLEEIQNNFMDIFSKINK